MKEYTIEIYEKKLSPDTPANTSGSVKLPKTHSHDASRIQYSIIEKKSKSVTATPSRHAMTTDVIYASGLMSHIFGQADGHVIFKHRTDGRETVVKVSKWPIRKLAENEKDGTVMFRSRLDLTQPREALELSPKLELLLSVLS